MKNNFLKYYKQIIFEEENKKESDDKSQSTPNKQSNQSNIKTKSGKQSVESLIKNEDSKNEVFNKTTEYDTQTQKNEVIAAGDEVYQAYKKDNSLFDEIKAAKKETKEGSESSEDGVTKVSTKGRTTVTSDAEGNSTTTVHDGGNAKITKNGGVTQISSDNTKGGTTEIKVGENGVTHVNGKKINQSIDINSSLFNSYYNEIFGIQTPEIIKEQQEDVTDGKYILQVDDNGSFKLVNANDDDTQTKFTIKDYKAVDSWIKTNFNIWIKYAQKYGGDAGSFSDQLIDKVVGDATKIDNKIQKSHLVGIINKIRANTSFKQFTAYFKNMSKDKGDLTDDQKDSIKSRYLYAMCMFIIRIIKYGAIDASSKAQIKKAKDQQTKKINRNKKIQAFKSACSKFAEDHTEVYVNVGNACDQESDTDDMLFNKDYKFKNYNGDVVCLWKGISNEIDSQEQCNELIAYLQGQKVSDQASLPLHPQAIAEFLSKNYATDTQSRRRKCTIQKDSKQYY